MSHPGCLMTGSLQWFIVIPIKLGIVFSSPIYPKQPRFLFIAQVASDFKGLLDATTLHVGWDHLSLFLIISYMYPFKSSICFQGMMKKDSPTIFFVEKC